ncbi:MAG: hypothetical protein EA398_15540 [Deltaproteobacteria bacterium]|nr:MAG: hypothetical protein EA398_15540 [Deltaproteobacteria bacterium]
MTAYSDDFAARVPWLAPHTPRTTPMLRGASGSFPRVASNALDEDLRDLPIVPLLAPAGAIRTCDAFLATVEALLDPNSPVSIPISTTLIERAVDPVACGNTPWPWAMPGAIDHPRALDVQRRMAAGELPGPEERATLAAAALVGLAASAAIDPTLRGPALLLDLQERAGLMTPALSAIDLLAVAAAWTEEDRPHPTPVPRPLDDLAPHVDHVHCFQRCDLGSRDLWLPMPGEGTRPSLDRLRDMHAAVQQLLDAPSRPQPPLLVTSADAVLVLLASEDSACLLIAPLASMGLLARRLQRGAPTTPRCQP